MIVWEMLGAVVVTMGFWFLLFKGIRTINASEESEEDKKRKRIRVILIGVVGSILVFAYVLLGFWQQSLH